MFRVDTYDTDDSLEVASIVSLEKSQCSGLACYKAAVTSIAKRFLPNASASSGGKVVQAPLCHLPSSTDGKPSRYTTVTSVISNHLKRRPTNVIPYQCSLSDIPDCLIRKDCHDSESTSATIQSTSASYDEILYYSYSSSYEDYQTYEVETVSTVSYSPKSWKSTVEFSGNHPSTPKKCNVSDTLDVVQSTETRTSTIEAVRHHSLRSQSVRRRGRISKASARILELPRDVEFDSSCDSSIDEDNHDMDYDSRGASSPKKILERFFEWVGTGS